VPKTVVLLHGAWLPPDAWDLFRGHYEGLGYRVISPPWPLEKPLEMQRVDPDPAFGRVGMRTLVDHHEALVRALPDPPILIGHALGGLLVQLLLDRGLGTAGVALCPMPPRWVLPTPTAMRALRPVLSTPSGWNRVHRMTFEHFQATFFNVGSLREQHEAYAHYVLPAPGRALFDATLGVGTGVRFRNPDRAPLLLVTADHDRTVPPSAVEANFRWSRRSPALTELHRFPDRSHFLIGDRRWEEVADQCIHWAEAVQRTAIPSSNREPEPV
jgi:pimeloyl-ACP methyl ester carboxylesterase